LQSVVICCSLLHHRTVCFSVLKASDIVSFSSPLFDTVRRAVRNCTTILLTATPYNAPLLARLFSFLFFPLLIANLIFQFRKLQYVAIHCNRLQRSVFNRNTNFCCAATVNLDCLAEVSRDSQTLQHTATYCNALQDTATHCNTLQHTVTHCTLQHFATHCNTQDDHGDRMSCLLYMCVCTCKCVCNTLQHVTGELDYLGEVSRDSSERYHLDVRCLQQ